MRLNWREGEMENELPNYAELESLTDREINIIVIEKLRSVVINQTNHLKHHWAITIVCLAALLTGLFNLSIALVILIVKS